MDAKVPMDYAVFVWQKSKTMLQEGMLTNVDDAESIGVKAWNVDNDDTNRHAEDDHPLDREAVPTHEQTNDNNEDAKDATQCTVFPRDVTMTHAGEKRKRAVEVAVIANRRKVRDQGVDAPSTAAAITKQDGVDMVVDSEAAEALGPESLTYIRAGEEGWTVRRDVRLVLRERATGPLNPTNHTAAATTDFDNPTELNGACWSPDGRRFLTGNMDGRVHVWAYPITPDIEWEREEWNALVSRAQRLVEQRRIQEERECREREAQEREKREREAREAREKEEREQQLQAELQEKRAQEQAEAEQKEKQQDEQPEGGEQDQVDVSNQVVDETDQISEKQDEVTGAVSEHDKDTVPGDGDTAMEPVTQDSTEINDKETLEPETVAPMTKEDEQVNQPETRSNSPEQTQDADVNPNTTRDEAMEQDELDSTPDENVATPEASDDVQVTASPEGENVSSDALEPVPRPTPLAWIQQYNTNLGCLNSIEIDPRRR